MSTYVNGVAPTSLDRAADALLEADAARQVRRIRRRLRGRTSADQLRNHVAGRRVLVTGASSGIGRGVALRLAEAGATVLAIARRTDLLDELARQAAGCDGAVVAHPCDLSDEAQVKQLVDRVIDEHGGVDIVINNAGRSLRRTLQESTQRLHDYERVMRLNFFGAVWLTAPLVDQMRRTGIAGHVINVSTMGTQFAGTPRFSAYMASKGALDQFTVSVAPETRADGIRWTTVHLPLVSTEMIEPAAHVWRRYPKLSLQTGVSMVLDAVVRAPARVTHPLGNVIGVLDRVATRSLEALKAREFSINPPPSAALPRVAIIGVGMSGLAMARKLRAAGSDDFVVFEKATSVGGTWRDNTYPGLACDVPAHYYCYRDSLQPNWSRLFAPGEEIKAYFENVAVADDLMRNIRFGTEIVDAEFVDGRWHLTTAAGERDVVDVLVCATGVLHHPRVPDIPGLNSFQGNMFHSARWDHSTNLDGARIGVIGTGSTGVQLTTALAERAGALSLFARTPQWVVALPNPTIPPRMRRVLARVPAANRGMYRLTGALFGALAIAPIRDGWQRKFFDLTARHGLKKVKDPDLRARLTPDDKVMCKRLVNSPGFYEAVQQPSVDVVTTGIDHVRPDGLVTTDGRFHPLDVLVLATGFDSHAYMRPMTVTGPGGYTLEQAWRDGPRAHNTTMIPGLPNLFLLMGPNSPIGNASLVPIAETQADFVVGWLRRMRDHGVTEVEPTRVATERFYDRVQSAMKGTVWVSGCGSWYLGPDGVPILWPWPLQEFGRRLGEPALGDYAVRTMAAAGRDVAYAQQDADSAVR